MRDITSAPDWSISCSVVVGPNCALFEFYFRPSFQYIFSSTAVHRVPSSFQVGFADDSYRGPWLPNSHEQSLKELGDATQLASSPYKDSMLPQSLLVGYAKTYCCHKVR